MERKNAWHTYTDRDETLLETLSADYMTFLNHSKTERMCTRTTIQMAEMAGYKNLKEYKKEGTQIQPGDKIYAVNMNKAIVLLQIGTDDISLGMNMLGAHIDSPRLDVKQNPLYEDSHLAYFDTHYYGGIKKYQWVAIPLALYGVVVKKTGEVVEVNIGDSPDDPVFCITDLLPHLSQEQLEKKAAKVIEGESLDLLIGSKPLKDEDKEGVLQNLRHILREKYHIEEEDFISAELEIVPAGKARELGFDRSMILAYGQDDRVCAFTSLRAMLEVDKVKRTTCCLLVDKEEIGSVGATGMHSNYFENVMAEVLDSMGCYSELILRRTLANSRMLSSDVSAGYDPLFASAFEKKNASF